MGKKQPKMPSELDDFFFDLQGYLVLQGALAGDEVRRLNAAIDEIGALPPGQWQGNVHSQERDVYHDEVRGINLQNIVESGAAFEELIDHQAWIEHMRRYIGLRQLFIDECFVSIRERGGFINIHSGGWEEALRTQYKYQNGKFSCGQINILVALSDIGPGDGATTIIPASHKGNICHPNMNRPFEERVREASDGVEGVVEVHLKAGDAILFVDALAHGSAARVNDGERRILVYRYGPYWGNTRYGYQYSPALLDRLTPARREILQPIPPRLPPPANDV